MQLLEKTPLYRYVGVWRYVAYRASLVELGKRRKARERLILWVYNGRPWIALSIPQSRSLQHGAVEIPHLFLKRAKTEKESKFLQKDCTANN